MKYGTLIFCALFMLLTTGCKEVEEEPGIGIRDNTKAITAFSFKDAENMALGADATGTVNESNQTIAVSVPYGTDVTALVADFSTDGSSVSVGGTDQTSGSTANDFSSDVTYTVMAVNTTTQNYTVTVTIAPSSAKSITAFSFKDAANTSLSVDATGTIDETNQTISVSVPFETDVAALVADFSTTGSSISVGSIDQTSGSTANDFSSAVTYTVTAANATTQTYTVTVAILAWVQDAYLKASNSKAGASFGFSLSISGDLIAVGVRDEASNATTIDNTDGSASTDDSNGMSGAVYVFKKVGSDWVQDAYLKASNSEASDQFGLTTAISGDQIVVGAAFETSNATAIDNTDGSASTDNSNNSSGAVYVFKKEGSDWVQDAYLKASNSEAGDRFGFSVSLSDNQIAVGASREESDATSIDNTDSSASVDNSNGASGAVYVFKKVGSDWVQDAYLKASNNEATDEFGYSVSISGDQIVVGAWREDSNATTIDNTDGSASADNSNDMSGAVYVFKKVGSDWVQDAYLKASNNEADDEFGMSVSISGDQIAVGASREDSNATTIDNTDGSASADNSNGSSGAVYVFKKDGSDWVQDAYLKASNNEAFDEFGYSVSISGDQVVVGALYEDSNTTTIDNTDGSASADNSNADSGVVYVFKKVGSNWVQDAYLKASNSEGGDEFGQTVAISGDQIVVGALGEDSNATTIDNTNGSASANNDNGGSGAVYVFQNR